MFALAAAVLTLAPAAPPNLPLPTLGGRQFWGDVRHRAGWRIQTNVLTGHSRLLDPHDVRRSWGTRGDCEAALAEAIDRGDLPRPAGDTVVLVHGMGRSSKCFAALADELRAGGFAVVPFDYPSLRQSLRTSAADLGRVTDSLIAAQDPADPVRLHFVGHSAGGLVIRAWGERAGPGVNVGRTALLGVPNAGAAMADRIRGLPGLATAFAGVYGPAGAELSAVAAESLAALPPPRGAFLTVVGCRGTAAGYNPLIPGDDDGTVAVAEARMPQETAFLPVTGVGHSFLMNDARVRAGVVGFLTAGGE